MRYPAINQYLETLANPYRMFRTLNGFEVERDAYDEIKFISGNYSATFQIRIGDSSFALKCYTRKVDYAPQVYEYLKSYKSPYTTEAKYLEDEIFVYDENDNGHSFPVVLTPWIDGEPLGNVIERLCRYDDREAIASIARKFDRMAMWLLAQEFAHGDLKNDNILVTKSGELMLIDYDGMFIPSLTNMPCSLVGSPTYQHPARTASFFNKHIDDYSIAVISVSLHALSEDTSLYEKYNEGDNLILNSLLIQKNKSPLLDQLERRWLDEGRLTLYSMCRMLRSPSPELDDVGRIIAAMCGETNLLAKYDAIDDSDLEMRLIRRDGRYGFLCAQTGHVAIEPVFEDAKCFSEEVAPVRINSSWRFIGRNGGIVLNCRKYDGIEPFREGLSLVRKGDKYGFIDHNGKEVIPLRFPFARSFRNGVAKVVIDGHCEYINKEGKFEKNT